jgi:hypothetical protein
VTTGAHLGKSQLATTLIDHAHGVGTCDGYPIEGRTFQCRVYGITREASVTKTEVEH